MSRATTAGRVGHGATEAQRHRGMRARSALLTLAALAATAGGQERALDRERSAFRYRRDVTLPAGDQFLVALPLPPELRARLQPELRDLRLVGADGREVPWVADRQAPREQAEQWSGSLTDARQEKRQSSQWLLDLGAPRRFGEVELRVAGTDFVKRLKLEASDDGQAWRPLRDDAGVFDRPWAGGRARRTTIELVASQTARYLRLTADDTRSAPMTVEAVTVRDVRTGPEARWERRATVVSEGGRDRWSLYRLEVEPGLPLERLTLVAADPAFSRRVRLREIRAGHGGEEQLLLGEGTLWRLKLDEAQLVGESLDLDVAVGSGGRLVLEVEDGDSPPLRQVSVRVGGPVTRLVFPRPAAAPTLYYGNPATRAPLYDLSGLQARRAVETAPGLAGLGPEAENPVYVRPAPLAQVSSSGAALEVRRWRHERMFGVPQEDLYTLTLTPQDLARARADLGDLRLVDGQGRQVPYILEPRAAEARLALSVEHDTPQGTTSRHRLTLPVDTPAGPPAPPVPLEALELRIVEPFFSRPARLSGRAPGAGRELRVWQGTLARRSESSSPLVLPLDGVARRELWLEIDEGDDRPLTLAQAEGVLRVARLAFKAAPGPHRLLVGNEEAAAPRYDLALLSREVLAYSALSVSPGALADNPAFRRTGAEYLRQAPPTLLLWGALLGAVIALLLMTARLLRSAQPAPSAARPAAGHGTSRDPSGPANEGPQDDGGAD